MKSKVGGWENARPFVCKNFWKEIMFYKTFPPTKKILEKKRKNKRTATTIQATFDPAKTAFVITTPGETWAMTWVS